MNRPIRPVRAAAVAVLVTAAALLTACSSASGDPVQAAASVAAVPDDGSQDASASPAPVATGPKVPKDKITPVTGTFTRKQKAYLVDRVPKGTDPAAILQVGQETCDRLGYAAKVDRDAAISAIVIGQITNPGPAVKYLCPQHQGLLDAAALGYADGDHTGKDIRPGRYYAPSPSKSCTWGVTGAGGKSLASGSSTTDKRVTLTIASGARSFTSSGCYAWLREGSGG
jgi:hypothetical protein